MDVSESWTKLIGSVNGTVNIWLIQRSGVDDMFKSESIEASSIPQQRRANSDMLKYL
jgi:hypothetical protein